MQLSLRREVQTRSSVFPPSSPLSRLFDFEVRYESPIPGMMIPVARAHLMMMAAFAVAFC
jgi:hypothetical protein